jgi:hypothetical protein
VKTILEIEITHPSTYPVVVNEEKDSIPEGVKVNLEVTEGLWAGASWTGKVIRTVEKK